MHVSYFIAFVGEQNFTVNVKSSARIAQQGGKPARILCGLAACRDSLKTRKIMRMRQ